MPKRVLIPLDGSEVPDSVVSAVLTLASLFHVEVVLVRVVEPAPSHVTGTSPVALNQLLTRMKEAHESTTRAGLDLRARGLHVAVQVRRGAPAAEILAAALEADVDFLVMPMQSRSGFGLRSFEVAEAVLRRARIPVVMMPPVEPTLTARTACDPELSLCHHA